MLDEAELASVIGPALAGAIVRRGYASLTPIQKAVLDPSLSKRDLRMTSQTGSGKTVAIGFVLRELVEQECASIAGIARPRALIVAPTRELAKQVEEELAWLYEPLHVRVASTTGGASFRDERRALAGGPAVIVGTPGRLLDYLKKKAIDPSLLGAVVLDEADRMLDLGFREDLEAILAFAPDGHRTHLMSATFAREVRALADRVQKDAAHVEGTRLGTANADIDHVIHVVAPSQRLDAIINLLLARPEEQTLVFARTRADVARIARELGQAGFRVSSLSGEMEQAARNRALSGFKRGDLRVLVATDVAARGIDVVDIARVIHAEPPTDADTYTHRSGRTGRAGRKGTSSVLVAPIAITPAIRLLQRARVEHRIEAVPSADEIRRAADDRLMKELVAADPEDFAGFDSRTWSLAKRLADSGNVNRVIARVLVRMRYAGPTEPREVRPVVRPVERIATPAHASRSHHGNDRKERDRNWVSFRVSLGLEQNADPRRLLPLVCRRGNIRGSDVGAIRIERRWSIVDVASEVAEAFARAAGEPDARDSRITIEPVQARSPQRKDGAPSPRSSPPSGGAGSSSPRRRRVGR